MIILKEKIKQLQCIRQSSVIVLFSPNSKNLTVTNHSYYTDAATSATAAATTTNTTSGRSSILRGLRDVGQGSG